MVIQIHAVDVAAEALRQADGGGRHIARDFKHLRLRRELRLLNQPIGGAATAGAQAGFAELGEKMMTRLAFFVAIRHDILLCGVVGEISIRQPETVFLLY